MRDGFVYSAAPARVVFGVGTLARLSEEVDRLGLRRIVLLATPRQEAAARAVAGCIGAAGLFASAAMHTLVEVTEAATAEVSRTWADGVVALGGGSTIGLGYAGAWDWARDRAGARPSLRNPRPLARDALEALLRRAWAANCRA